MTRKAKPLRRHVTNRRRRPRHGAAQRPATVAAVEAALRASVNFSLADLLYVEVQTGEMFQGATTRGVFAECRFTIAYTAPHLRRVMPKFRSLATDTLWVDVDGRLVKVEPGEVIDIPTTHTGYMR